MDYPRYLPVPVTAYGPMISLSLRVHRLSHTGFCHEALEAADAYQWLARAAGDEKTVGFLMQGRMYAYLMLGRVPEAVQTGEELLLRHRATGYAMGEAKVLCDLAELYVLEGRLVEGMRHLARAGTLLARCEQRGDRYLSALSSLAEAANAAELYETAAEGYERLIDRTRHDFSNPIALAYATTLLFWGLRLEHLGRLAEAQSRVRRSAAITGAWLAGADDDAAEVNVRAMHALALARLGRLTEAEELASAAIMPLRAREQYYAARVAHLALGTVLRARGDAAGARRELLAADELCTHGARGDEQLIIRYEMARLAAETSDEPAARDLFATVRMQTQHLWQVRLQRLAMLRQAHQREEIESQRVRAEEASMQDPLTGLGNRRRFDQLMTAIDAGRLPVPATLLIIDVDRFKAVNDTYTHSAGDQVLRTIADVLGAHCRDGDTAVRYAGDEFTVFLHADLRTSVEIAERMRRAVHACDVSGVAPGLPVSISTGLAALRPGMSGEDLFRAADRRLYEAKRAGRNRVAA